MESNVLEKSTNNSAVSRFSAQTPLNIRRIVRICDVVDRFLRGVMVIVTGYGHGDTSSIPG